MQPPNPEDTFFLLKWSGQLIALVVILLLALLTYLGKRDQAKTATAILQEKPLTHSDLEACKLQVQLDIMKAMTEGFNKLSTQLMKEIALLHVRINQIEKG